MEMQHPWLLPFLHPLTQTPTIQLALPPHPHAPPPPHLAHPHGHGISSHGTSPHAHLSSRLDLHVQQQQVQQQHQQQHLHHAHHHQLTQTMAAGQMGLQPMLSPHSGALLLPALQQNAAAAVAAFAAAAAAAHQHQQQQQQQQHGTAAAAAAFMAGSSPVLMAAGPFQRVARLKAAQVSERENHPADANGSSGNNGASGVGGPSSSMEKRKHHDDMEPFKDVKRAKIETRALKAKRPGFSDERYNETEYYFENGLRKVYPYYFTFTTFTKGRWVGEKILDVFAREFRAHPVSEYERCIKSGTLTVNYVKVDVDYRLKHNDLLANIVHRHETPIAGWTIEIIHNDDDMIVVDKPCSIPVHPCGRYRHNTVAFILAKEHNLRNLRTIHRLDRLTSGLLMFGRTQEKARQMEQQIRTRLVSKHYVCRVEGEFPSEEIVCNEPIEVVSYKIGVCRVSPKGKDCRTEFERLSYNGKTSVVLCKPHTGRMHQIRVHLQYLGYPIVNDPLYNHVVFGPEKGKGGTIGKTDEELIRDLISIHNAENWLGGEGDDFAPGFFSAVAPPDVADAVTPASSSESAGLASGVSSRSPTPDALDIKEEAALTTVSSVELNHADGSNSMKQQLDEKQSTESPKVEIVEANTAGSVTQKAETSNSVKIAPDSATKPEETVSLASEISNVKIKQGEATIEASDNSYNSGKLTADEHCYECKVRFRDPKPRDLMMFLHAWRYKGPGWSYETRLPAWAQEDWQSDEY